MRVSVKDEQTVLPVTVSTMEEFIKQLLVDDEAIFPWKVDKSTVNDDEVVVELYDNIHSREGHC